MNAIVMIPARYASSRLPGKPLLAETGKPLIQHTVESVSAAERVDRVVVATDDPRIVDAVKGFDGEAVMTSERCRTGSDRLAEAAETLGLSDDQIVVNVQGDEPEMTAECVDVLVGLLSDTDAEIATLATPITPEEAEQVNMTKVVCDSRGMAMYFSRAKIPHDRDGDTEVPYLLHHGIYAYRVGFLKRFTKLPSTPAEQGEKLEQLRAMEHGFRIAVGVVDYRGARIDTPDEYAEFVERISKR